MKTREELIDSYDRLAEDYARIYGDELDHKPFDRELLRHFVRALPAGLAACDLGCGPGHVADFLRALGAEVLGIDLSPRMVFTARRRYPAVEYRVGDMLDLDLADGCLGGIVALYSIIHLRPDQVDSAFGEMFRVIAPGGAILVSFHRGQGLLHDDESLGHPVAFDCTLFEPEDVAGAMERNGFWIEEIAVRRPYDFEYPTTRAYVWGATPQAAA